MMIIVATGINTACMLIFSNYTRVESAISNCTLHILLPYASSNEFKPCSNIDALYTGNTRISLISICYSLHLALLFSSLRGYLIPSHIGSTSICCNFIRAASACAISAAFRLMRHSIQLLPFSAINGIYYGK